MYGASDKFHQAVKNHAKQLALLLFKDAVFTSDDISSDGGIEYNDNWNLDNDISIGGTPSSELNFTLFNHDQELNDYEFGNFIATIGVKIGETTYKQKGRVMVVTPHAEYIADDKLKRNGVDLTLTSFKVKCIIAIDGIVYVFGGGDRFAAYDDKTGANITYKYDIPEFMRKKANKWEDVGVSYNNETNNLFIYKSGTREQYEFVPLGVFMAERPNENQKIELKFTCYDQMQMFDYDMPSDTALAIKYPITFEDLLQQLCMYVHVESVARDFINGKAKLTSRPAEFDDSTMRTVVGWIAEAACANACFNRDGKLDLKWISDGSTITVDETDYSEFEPYYYEVPKVTKLYNKDSGGDYNNTQGTGDNCYVIQDNPLLKGVS